MAPINVCNLALSAKDKLKMRKPVVEKMRRDRINVSIEQLKKLLESEFKAHHPSSKLEKADILEMAVGYLRQNSQPASFKIATPQHSYSDGFYQCLEETLRFLSFQDPTKESQFKVLKHFQNTQAGGRDPLSSAAALGSQHDLLKGSSQGDGKVLWRPW
ncbi:transcription factor HES-5-like [Polyodon spathula]|uniref:transcription factor HES-5-like n=1 Tax=Polyodon spathula TaxID=7913 RepID=UPI001B7F168B|nr:transcription factor HES-5-like [Polyodon spathula]